MKKINTRLYGPVQSFCSVVMTHWLHYWSCSYCRALNASERPHHLAKTPVSLQLLSEHMCRVHVHVQQAYAPNVVSDTWLLQHIFELFRRVHKVVKSDHWLFLQVRQPRCVEYTLKCNIIQSYTTLYFIRLY